VIFIPCYHPLKAVRTNNLVDGKKKIIFWKPGMDEQLVINDGCEILKIPCGQCVGCRLEYSRQWAVRCCLEAKQYKHNYFVTLTYDNEFVPLREHVKVNVDTGEVEDIETVMTLLPDDLKGFMKRLRTNMQRESDHIGIRFFACGEYGPKNMRPHYHLILFNCPLPDLVFERYSDGYTYYRSPLLEKTWKKGFVLVTDFSFETAAYVARYMLKKHKGKDSGFYAERGIEPEFTRCSRKPGLARAYLDENADFIYNYDQVIITNGKGVPIRCKPPKYFDRIFDELSHTALEDLKAGRKETAIHSMQNELSKTDLCEEEYLTVKENNKMLSISSLKREL